MPANPGATIFRHARATRSRLQARALDKFIKKERLFVVHDNVFFNQRGDVICSGRGWTIRPNKEPAHGHDVRKLRNPGRRRQRIEGPVFAVSRETITAFCDASLDYNPLHLDDDYMQGNFGKTSFGGIIMHGMNNFGLITRMLTDWAYPAGGIHRRLETRWLEPVRPGDTIQPFGESSNPSRKPANHAGSSIDVIGAQPARREGRHRRGAGRVSPRTGRHLDPADEFGGGIAPGTFCTQAMMPVSVAGLSMRTVAPRTPDHTAMTDVGPELLSGVTTDSVVGTRPVLGGTASL